MQRFHPAFVAFMAATLLVIPVACGGGGASPYVGPSFGPIAPSLPAISFGSPSPSATACPSTGCSLTFTVHEPGYTGAFHGKSSNANVVTLTLQGVVQQARSQGRVAQDTYATFVATAVGTGTATLTITDDNNNSTTIPVTVSAGLTVNPQLQR